MKYCEDCIHIDAQMDRKFAHCLHDEAISNHTVDSMVSRSLPDMPIYNYASIERKHGKCGIDAKNFEPGPKTECEQQAKGERKGGEDGRSSKVA